jgi:hypothetical protein
VLVVVLLVIFRGHQQPPRPASGARVQRYPGKGCGASAPPGASCFL